MNLSPDIAPVPSQRLQHFRGLVAADLESVNEFIVSQLQSEVNLVENIGHYIVAAGGKRLRPLLVLLAAHCCGVRDQRHVSLATVIEFIHTATLLHDDVVDMSELRRGRPTVNAEWNNPSSVLVGDFIYSRAFQILVQIGDMSIMRIIADTTNKIAEGEVLQLITKNNPSTSEADYMRVIEHKTAILFQAAAHSAAVLTNAPAPLQQQLREFGMHLGIAFQLVDDVLDYAGDSAELGKNIGDDLAEGKPTLPLIHAMEHGSAEQAKLIRRCIEADRVNSGNLDEVFDIVLNSGALDYTRALAERQAELADQQ
ncbi:MAG: polyprenyl synthetase family protein, partial [Gammaproteobacteria bacterium]